MKTINFSELIEMPYQMTFGENFISKKMKENARCQTLVSLSGLFISGDENDFECEYAISGRFKYWLENRETNDDYEEYHHLFVRKEDEVEIYRVYVNR